MSEIGAFLTCDARVLRCFVGTARALFLRGALNMVDFFLSTEALGIPEKGRRATVDLDNRDPRPLCPGMIFGVKRVRSDLIPSRAIFIFSASASRARWTSSRRSQYISYHWCVFSGSSYCSHRGMSRRMKLSHSSWSSSVRWGDSNSIACYRRKSQMFSKSAFLIRVFHGYLA